MPKRIFWLTAGAAIGAGSSLWAERKVRRSVQQAAARLQPDALVVEVGRSARQVAGTAGDRVRGAMSSGRDEMQRREEELWAALAAQGVETGRAPISEPDPALSDLAPVPDPSAHPAHPAHPDPSAHSAPVGVGAADLRQPRRARRARRRRPRVPVRSPSDEQRPGS